MDLDQFPLWMFEVDCDGSACGSPRDLGQHVHRAEIAEPLGRVVFRGGQRVHYADIMTPVAPFMDEFDTYHQEAMLNPEYAEASRRAGRSRVADARERRVARAVRRIHAKHG